MPGIYEGMMGTQSLDEEKLRMLAEQLRGGSGTGARLATSSLAPIQNQGRLMQTQANQQAQQVGLMQSRGEANRAREASEAARAAEKDKATRFSKFSNSFTDRIKKGARKAEETQALISRFGGNAFAGDIPLLGTAENWAASKFPGMHSEESKRSASWWRDWNNYYNNPTRHELFGSALTSTEKAAWAAANINPDMSDEEIEKSLQGLSDVLKKRSLSDVQSMRAQGMPDEWSQSVYQDILSDEEFADPSAYRTSLQERLSDPDYQIKKEEEEELGGWSIEEL